MAGRSHGSSQQSRGIQALGAFTRPERWRPEQNLLGAIFRQRMKRPAPIPVRSDQCRKKLITWSWVGGGAQRSVNSPQDFFQGPVLFHQFGQHLVLGREFPFRGGDALLVVLTASLRTMVLEGGGPVLKELLQPKEVHSLEATPGDDHLRARQFP